jgi:hypothetical protein
MSAAETIVSALTLELPAERIAGAISEALTATQANRDGSTTPDYRTRLAAAQLALNYLAGRPIERQQIITANVSTDETEAALAQRIADSPSLKARLRELLAE